MSETVETQTKPKQANFKASREGSADARVFAQVDKWMAMIREISREPAKT